MTPLFATEQDREREEQMARTLEQAWDCTFNRYPDQHEVDYWGERNGKVTCFLEMKSRKIKYDTVYLALRKWTALMLHNTATGKPCLFVAGYPDGTIYWVDVRDVDAKRMSICQRRNHRADQDREPVIEVPLKEMNLL